MTEQLNEYYCASCELGFYLAKKDIKHDNEFNIANSQNSKWSTPIYCPCCQRDVDIQFMGEVK